MEYKPRWYQTGAIQAIFDYVREGVRGNPLIALPTGTGKGVVIGEFAKIVLQSNPSTRLVMATHVKELIRQNANKLIEMWPLAPLGIYSAGLNMRELSMPITFAGIASVYKRAELFGHVDILLIDEAHLLSPDAATMYQMFIKVLREKNPHLIVIGFTATAYRMGQGMLADGDGIFTDIIYDMTDIKGFNQLISEGFLAPLFPKPTHVTMDVSNVGIVNGDFKKGELENAVNNDKLTLECLNELCYYGQDRQHWMIFASGIEHAERISYLLNSVFKTSAVAIHSKNSDAINKENIEKFESGDFRCAVNMNKLTTGYDFPPIDLIGMMRPSQSPGLWVQMCGRGTRPSPDSGKSNCLVLDFAGNTPRLGPINDPVKPRPKGSGGGGDAPVRICPKCGVYCPAAARSCFACGYEFEFSEKLTHTAGTEELIRSDTPIVEEFKVKKVYYTKKQKSKIDDTGEHRLGKPYLQVQYYCSSNKMFTKNVFLDAPYKSGLGHQAREWFRQTHPTYDAPNPENCAPYASATDAAISISTQFKVPKFLRVWVNRQYPEIVAVEY